jgi:hypothetical protein
MKSALLPHSGYSLSRELAGIAEVSLKARDADTLFEVALAIKAAMPVILTPEVSLISRDADLDLWSVTVRTRRDTGAPPDDFTRRSFMSYRAVLRTIPKALRRQWLCMRYRFAAPRVLIGCARAMRPDEQRSAP